MGYLNIPAKTIVNILWQSGYGYNEIIDIAINAYRFTFDEAYDAYVEVKEMYEKQLNQIS